MAAFMLAGVGAGVMAVLAVSDSGLIRAVGGAAGGVTGLGAAVWVDVARERRETAATAVRARARVLDRVVSEPGRDLSVLGLLLATRKVAAPFRGRSADLTWLQNWCDALDGHPVAVVTGPAGVGKTRLATQFASARPVPWKAGWLHPGCGRTALQTVRACPDPALILIDDADTSPDTAALLAALAGQPRTVGVRVLLLARSAEAITQMVNQLPDAARWITAPDNLPVCPIGPFGSTDDHDRWFGEAVRAYATARRTPPPDLPQPTVSGRSGTADEPILAIQARALLAVLDSERHRPWQPGAQPLPFGRVAEALFAHEQRRWQQAAQQAQWGLTDLTVPVQQRAVAALMLAGVTAEEEAITALRTVPDLTDATSERLARIARWAFHLYPPGPVEIKPYMLAEWFLITQLTTTPGLAGHLPGLAQPRILALLILFAHASDHMPAAIPLYIQVIRIDPASLIVLGADAALTAGTARPHLDAALAELVTSTDWTTDALTVLRHHVPQGTLPRIWVAASAVLVDHEREKETPEDLANALNSYGAGLRKLGRHRDALAIDQEALALWRELAADNPAHRPDLAGALNSYGTGLRDLGRHQDALPAFQEALALRRALAADNPAHHQPGLANALNSYGGGLRDLGRHQDALATGQEALALWRELAADSPAYQPDLALALSNCGIGLSDLGRHQDALATEQEALALWRELAADNPAHQPGLARALNSYGAGLRDLGRHRDAQATGQEALALWRALAADNPAHQPGLARALSNYGIGLRELGRHQDALAAFQEALALWCELAADNPAHHQPGLAGALGNYGNSLSELGRHRDALATGQEALALWRALAADNPAHQPGLARTLSNYGIGLHELGRHQDALAAFQAALELYERLADSDPELYEKTYQHQLGHLRRVYELQGEQAASINLLLRRAGKTSD